MENSVALVTGASSGFGRAIAGRLAARGMRLVLLARRTALRNELAATLRVPCHVATCDVRDSDALRATVSQLPAEFAAVDVLVNNAGLALGLEGAHRADWSDWQQMIETNCSAVAHLTRLVLPGMVERRRGHIFLMGSVAGHYAYPGGNAYGATKAFIEQFARGLRADLVAEGIRVTHIAPGLSGGSEFSQVRFHGDAARAQAVYAGTVPLQPADIAECVSWALEQPPHVNINTIEVMPICQASGPLAVVRKYHGKAGPG